MAMTVTGDGLRSEFYESEDVLFLGLLNVGCEKKESKVILRLCVGLNS